MKHIASDFHFVPNKVQIDILPVSHVPSYDQLAVTLTIHSQDPAS